MNKNCSEYLDNISVLFNIISRDKKTVFDEYVRGIGEFVREDDYDYYDFFIDIIDGASNYLECEILDDFNFGGMEDMERLCRRFLRKKCKIDTRCARSTSEKKELIINIMNQSNDICDNLKNEIEKFL